MKKKEDRTQEKRPHETVEPTAGGRRICPDCSLPFRDPDRFDQHRAAGCKSVKTDGPTFSQRDPESETAE